MRQGPSYWFDTRVYLAVVAALLLLIAFYNHYIALLGAVLLTALYLYGRERHKQQQKELNEYITAMVTNVNDVADYALENIPMGMLLVDAGGEIHWKNTTFDRWMGEVDSGGTRMQLANIWPEFPLEQLWDKTGSEIFHADGRSYQVIYNPIEHSGSKPILALYMTDITDVEALRSSCHEALPVLAYIQIDNVDDVLHGMNETQRTAVLVDVGKALSVWVGAMDGIIKKHSKDTYLAIYNRRALHTALADRFEILDKVRAIQLGNRIPVTLSIGVAADEASLAAMGERAQACLDLALGRGGDQVAVHMAGKMHFYGGKTKAVEKNTRVKARLVAQAIRESMEAASNIIVMGHAGEDFDSLGAAMGVAKMSRHLGKPTAIVVSQISTTVSKLQELASEYEEYEGLLHWAEDAAELVMPGTLVLVVDTHRSTLIAAPEILQLTEKIIIIDHHRRGEDFITNPLLVYLEPSASSTSEMVTELLMYFDDKIELTRLEATALYAGIVVDTKNFAVQSGVRTFDSASYLRRAGADPTLVRHLFRVDFSTMKMRAEIISTAEQFPNGLTVAICPPNIKKAQIAAAQAADVLLRIEGVRVSFVLFALEDGVGISARSYGDVNVQVIMEKFGGGGHQTVAAAQIRNQTIDAVKERLIQISAQHMEESERNESNSTTRS